MATILERNKKVKAPQKTREEYAEDALYREVWEDVNNEKTVNFIKKYYRHFLAAALILMIGITVVQLVIHNHNQRKIALATNYESAVMALDANALAALSNNAYGATADLALFQAYLLDGDMKKLENLAENGASRDFRDLARMHIVQNRGDEMTGEDVEKYLSDMNTKKSPFYYTSRLLVAQKYLATGNRDAANKWLDVIISDTDAPAAISATAQTLK